MWEFLHPCFIEKHLIGGLVDTFKVEASANRMICADLAGEKNQCQAL